MFEIIPILAFNDNYIWLLLNKNNQQAAVVDPGDADPVIRYLSDKPYQLTAILITHHHWDHTGGIDKLVEQYQIPVYGPAHESIPHIQYKLTEHDHITLTDMAMSFDILDIPAHTSGHIAYYGHGMLFCGDTLFLAGCGRLFEGTAEQMYHSLNKLAQLPPETLVYCGHEYTLNNLNFAAAVEPNNPAIQQRIAHCQQLREQDLPTVPGPLSLEKLTNPFLRTDQLSVIKAAEKIAGQTLKNPVQILSTIRHWKDHF